ANKPIPKITASTSVRATIAPARVPPEEPLGRIVGVTGGGGTCSDAGWYRGVALATSGTDWSTVCVYPGAACWYGSYGSGESSSVYGSYMVIHLSRSFSLSFVF